MFLQYRISFGQIVRQIVKDRYIPQFQMLHETVECREWSGLGGTAEDLHQTFHKYHQLPGYNINSKVRFGLVNSIKNYLSKKLCYVRMGRDGWSFLVFVYKMNSIYEVSFLFVVVYQKSLNQAYRIICVQDFSTMCISFTFDRILINSWRVDNSFGVTLWTAFGLDLTVTSFPNLS